MSDAPREPETERRHYGTDSTDEVARIRAGHAKSVERDKSVRRRARGWSRDRGILLAEIDRLRKALGEQTESDTPVRPDPTRRTWGPAIKPDMLRVWLHRRFHRDPTCNVCQYGDRSWWMADTPGYFDREASDAG